MHTRVWSPILAALREPELRRLLAASGRRELERGAYLAVAGEPPVAVHLVEHGLAKLMAADHRGTEITLGLVTEGDLVGELAALERTPHETDALALMPLRVTSFDARMFAEVITGSRAALLEMTRAAAHRNRALARATLEKASAQVPERLAGSLLDLAEVLGTRRGDTVEMELPLSQTDLGNLAGMSRETTCKTMRRLRERGLIDHRGRHLKILRPDLLEYLRCGRTSGRGQERNSRFKTFPVS